MDTQGYTNAYSIIKVAGCLKIGTCEFRGGQLSIERATFSYQYYILVIGDKVDEEPYFTHVDVDFDETYGNKLR
jgi:hypothetical protein